MEEDLHENQLKDLEELEMFKDLNMFDQVSLWRKVENNPTNSDPDNDKPTKEERIAAKQLRRARRRERLRKFYVLKNDLQKGKCYA
jgi:hypothetical protein